MGLLELMRVRIRDVAIGGNVGGTRQLEMTTANIYTRNIILQSKIVNNIVHEIGTGHDKVPW